MQRLCSITVGKQLREELKTNKSILFTLIHKFRYDKGKKYPVLSERDDIIVIVDEYDIIGLSREAA